MGKFLLSLLFEFFSSSWESIRNLLSPEQKNELLQIVTAAIKETTDDRFLPV
jgi:hypothetical protein